MKNNRLYNAGSELNEQTKNYETFYRDYDPALGRFNQIDPLASSFGNWTPYNYAFNDPVAFNDPNGDFPRHGNSWFDDGVNYANMSPYESLSGASSTYTQFGGNGMNWSGHGTTGSVAAMASDVWNSTGEFGGQRNYVTGEFRNFESDREAADAAIIYLNYTNGWSHTEIYKNRNYKKLTASVSKVVISTENTPVIYIENVNAPNDFDLDGYISLLYSELVKSGFNEGLEIKNMNLFSYFLSALLGETYGSVKLAKARAIDKMWNRAGHAVPFSNKTKVLFGGITRSTQYYVHGTMHEIGHGMFGFGYPKHSEDITNIMYFNDYNLANRYFNQEQIEIIKNSEWGN